MSIRPANADDYEAIERLFAQQSERHARLHPTHVRRVSPCLDADAFAEAIGGEGREIAVVEEGGSIVAAAMLATRIMDGKYTVPRQVAHVHEIIVDASLRRQGVGRTLMAHIEAWARARSREAVELNVWANNAGAMRFYEELGFTVLRYEMHRRLD